MHAQASSCYQCVICGAPVESSEPAATTCGVCESERPSIAGVQVRVVQATPKLRATVDGYKRYARNLKYARDEWESLRSSTENTARRAHAERAIAAQDSLLAFSDEVHAPIERALAGLPAPHWLDDVLSLDGANAWEIDHMLSYFYHDWHGTGDYPVMRDRIHAAIENHASGASRLLVVGAGACGFVRDMAKSGFEVHALDLSLPCLMLAERLLQGDSLEVTIPHKFERDWRRATLPGTAPLARPPRLSVANAARLPIQDGSFPVVVTQYLVDIAPNPTQIITEMARVLEPGGIWVNHGLPFGLSSDPIVLGPIADDALAPVLGNLGFELISLERHAYRLSDTGTLFEWPEVTTHWPQLSVARRTSTTTNETPDVFQRFRAGRRDEIWNCQPRRLPGRLLRGGPGINVSEPSAAIVRWLGQRADGRTPLSAYRSAARSVDARLTDFDIVEMLRHLCDEGMLTLAPNHG